MRIEDFRAFKGKTKDITEKLALPGEPTHFSLVEVPKGTALHKSVAGAQKWYDKAGNFQSSRTGGAVQYEILGYKNKDLPESWFREVGSIN